MVVVAQEVWVFGWRVRQAMAGCCGIWDGRQGTGITWYASVPIIIRPSRDMLLPDVETDNTGIANSTSE